jgi:tetratricopeptide (TPR) repeat protein
MPRSYPIAHHWYAVYLTAMRRFDEARQAIERAQALDPTSLAINTDVGFVLYYGGQYDAAIKQLRIVIEMNPQFPLARLWLGRSYQEKLMYDDAIAEFRQAATVLHDWPVVTAAIGYAQAASGRTKDARATLAEMNRLSTQRYVTPYGMALIHAGLGETREALAWLDRALEDRSHWLVWLTLDPRLQSLRADSRYGDLLSSVGLR